MILAAVNYESPLFWALLVGWILTVTLHEFAHGMVAYWGGDYTIRDRGGLTLNPFQYVDPVFSIIVPAIMLAIGGIPLPGGVTYVNTGLLRGRAWEVAVALAGPAMNLLIFFLCIIPLHPAFGWVTDVRNPTNMQLICGALGTLQFLTVLLNLVPVPPLDGFRALSPLLPRDQQIKLSTPPTSTTIFLIYFLALWNIPQIIIGFVRLQEKLLNLLGFGAFSKLPLAMFAEVLYR